MGRRHARAGIRLVVAAVQPGIRSKLVYQLGYLLSRIKERDAAIGGKPHEMSPEAKERVKLLNKSILRRLAVIKALGLEIAAEDAQAIEMLLDELRSGDGQ